MQAGAGVPDGPVVVRAGFLAVAVALGGLVLARAGSRAAAGVPDELVLAQAQFLAAVGVPDALAAQAGCDSVGAPDALVVVRAGLPAAVEQLDALAAQVGCDSALLSAWGPARWAALPGRGHWAAPQVPARPDVRVAAERRRVRGALRRARRGSRQPVRE